MSRDAVGNVSEQKIAASEGRLFVRLEVRRDKDRTNQMGRDTCTDASLPGEIYSAEKLPSQETGRLGQRSVGFMRV